MSKLTKVQEKRLLNVAKALRESRVPRMFDMSTYVHDDPSPRYNEAGEVIKNEKNFCGTPACALGHYAARTDLQRLLKITVDKTDYGNYADMVYFGDKTTNEWGDTSAGWNDEAVLEHFGITESEACELFDGDGCGNAKTALQAAKYIERFVARKQYPGRGNV